MLYKISPKICTMILHMFSSFKFIRVRWPQSLMLWTNIPEILIYSYPYYVLNHWKYQYKLLSREVSSQILCPPGDVTDKQTRVRIKPDVSRYSDYTIEWRRWHSRSWLCPEPVPLFQSSRWFSMKHQLRDWTDGPVRLGVSQPKPFVCTSPAKIQLPLTKRERWILNKRGVILVWEFLWNNKTAVFAIIVKELNCYK